MTTPWKVNKCLAGRPLPRLWTLLWGPLYMPIQSGMVFLMILFELGSKNGTWRSDRFSLPVAWRVKNFEVANETWDLWIRGTLANDMGNLRIIAVSLLPFQKCLCNRVVSFFSWTTEECNIACGKKEAVGAKKHRDFAALVRPDSWS